MNNRGEIPPAPLSDMANRGKIPAPPRLNMANRGEIPAPSLLDMADFDSTATYTCLMNDALTAGDDLDRSMPPIDDNPTYLPGTTPP